MKLSTIVGGILVISAGCGAASAQIATAGAKHVRPGGTAIGAPPAERFGNRSDVRVRHDRGNRRDSGRHDRFRGFVPWGYGYWGDGDGYAHSEVTRDMFGYFGAGGGVRFENGEAVYDYDRSYPYEWYGNAQEPIGARGNAYASGSYSCETEWVPGDGGRTAVRVCRR